MWHRTAPVRCGSPRRRRTNAARSRAGPRTAASTSSRSPHAPTRSSRPTTGCTGSRAIRGSFSVASRATEPSACARSSCQDPSFGERGFVDVAAAPGGGCYVLYDDKLVSRPSRRQYRRLTELSGGCRIAGGVRRRRVRGRQRGGRRRSRDRALRPKPRAAPLLAAAERDVRGASAVPFHGIDRRVRRRGVGRLRRAHRARHASGLTRTVVPPVPQSQPQSLVEARDGSMWFAEPRHSALGRIAPDGALTEFTL